MDYSIMDGVLRVATSIKCSNVVYLALTKINLFIDETIDYTLPQLNDIHLVSGALKLYFRELPEPLIPFNMFEKFVSSMSKSLVSY